MKTAIRVILLALIPLFSYAQLPDRKLKSYTIEFSNYNLANTTFDQFAKTAKKGLIVKSLKTLSNDLFLEIQLPKLRKTESHQLDFKLMTRWDTISIQPEMIKGEMKLGFGDQLKSHRLLWEDPYEVHEFNPNDLSMSITTEVWGQQPIDCTKPPRFNWERYVIIAGASALLEISGFLLKPSSKKEYDHYKRLIFADELNAKVESAYDKANSLHKGYMVLTRGGTILFLLDVLAAGIDYFFILEHKKTLYEDYCKEPAKFSLLPMYEFTGSTSPSNQVGLKLTYRF